MQVYLLCTPIKLTARFSETTFVSRDFFNKTNVQTWQANAGKSLMEESYGAFVDVMEETYDQLMAVMDGSNRWHNCYKRKVWMMCVCYVKKFWRISTIIHTPGYSQVTIVVTTIRHDTSRENSQTDQAEFNQENLVTENFKEVIIPQSLSKISTSVLR